MAASWKSSGSQWTADEIEKWKSEREEQPAQEQQKETKDPWQKGDPWGGAAKASASPDIGGVYQASASPDIGGVYQDEWGKSEVTLTLGADGKLFAAWPGAEGDPDEGTFEHGVLSLWKLTGEVLQNEDNAIRWSNGSKWVRLPSQSSASVPVAAPPHQEQSWKNGSDWEQPSAAAQDPKWNDSSGWQQPQASEAAVVPTAAEDHQSHQKWQEGSTWQPDAEYASRTAAGIADAQLAPAADSLADDPWKTAEVQQQSAGAGAWSTFQARDGADDLHPSGATGAEEDRTVQTKARWRDFKAYQDWYISKNILAGKTEVERAEDELRLFGQGPTGEGCDFALYEDVPCDITGPKSENIPKHISSFQQLIQEFSEFFPPALADNIRRCGYKTPTPVQKYAIPAALVSRDIMCVAQTGSGKTAAFLMPALAGLIKNHRAMGALSAPHEGPCKPDTLVISPTRELCVQIFTEAEKFFHNTDFRAIRIYGQDDIKTQIGEVAKGADLIVATPGRLWDFVSAGIIDVKEVNCLVLDEADRMMQMQQDSMMKAIVEDFGMPSKENRQTLMFSATFPEACQKLAEDYLFEHLFISVGVVGGACRSVTQNLLRVAPEDKYQKLVEFIDNFLEKRQDKERLLVFTNSKLQAKGLDEKLYELNVDSGALHGDLKQQDREGNLEKFRKGEIDVMIATDVASRGLDIAQVSQVLNYDLPFSIDVYVQRIGRTGRIGHRGNATTFVAVGNDGQWHDSSHEQQDVLRELPKVLREAGMATAVPQWLEDKILELDAAKSTSTWNARSNWVDMRNSEWQAQSPAPADDNWVQSGAPATDNWALTSTQ